MKSKFYHGLKENLDSGDFSAKKCALLMDEYTSSFKCKGDECSKLKDIKDGFAYILHKYKYVSRLQKQNESIFSQILHDIKSPMLGVKFALENAKRDSLSDEIYAINLGVLQIIHDFLTLYSFKDGFKSASFEKIFPLKILKNETKIYSPLFRQKELKLTFLGEQDFFVYSYGAILSRIVSNLISNAIKYAPKKGNIVFNVIDDENNIVITICNEVQNKIVTDESSYGLGLFITKRLARRINAHLDMKKNKDKITFELKMPKIDHLNRVR